MNDVTVHSRDSFCASVNRSKDHGPALSLPSHLSKLSKAVDTVWLVLIVVPEVQIRRALLREIADIAT